MKILVAEDDKVFRCFLTEVLREAGYSPVAEESGRLAWERLNSEGADLGVFDVNMPEMNGFDLLSRIRASDKFREMPIMMLTVREYPEDQVKGYDSGADDYLAKPFNREIFLARIKVLERRLLQRGGGQ